MMGAIAKNLLNPVPIDPITSTVLEHLPRGVQTALNPAGPLLKAAVGQRTAAGLLDPLSVGNLTNPQSSQKQVNALLASSPNAETPEYPSTQPTLLG